jgi:hypothetical protein
VYAKSKAIETNQKMFALTFNVCDLFISEPLDVKLAVALHMKHLFVLKLQRLFFENNYGWSFGHAGAGKLLCRNKINTSTAYIFC